MIVLSTKKEVDKKDRDGGTGDDHDPITQEKKSEHVVHLTKPHVVQYKEEFDEDGAKREDTNQSH